MQTLTCSTCGVSWEREPRRGRPPKQCDGCKGNSQSAVEAPPVPSPTPTPERPSERRPELMTLPTTKRTSGWCTEYDPAPAAQHYKCDGDLGKYRCPCECHEWDS